MTIIAAVDGSSLGNPGPGGWAWYLDENCWEAGAIAQTTNNICELTALERLLAATEHRRDEALKVLADSQYVINIMTKWRWGWKKAGWRKADGKPIKNLELVQRLDRAISGRKVEFQWVRGHAGHALNEAADTAARDAATALKEGKTVNIGPGFTDPTGPVGTDEAPVALTCAPSANVPPTASATEKEAKQMPPKSDPGQKMNVESFNLDHRQVKAPYVRVADRKELPGGDVLIKYDVRLRQPNAGDFLDMKAVHSIEHLSAELMRNHTDRLIDFSPMGCQTGFYALTLGLEMADFLPILQATCEDILAATEVPAANEVQCGWGANHSLAKAKLAISQFLRHRASWEEVGTE